VNGEGQGDHLKIGVLSALASGSYMSRVTAGAVAAAEAEGARVVLVQTLDLRLFGAGSEAGDQAAEAGAAYLGVRAPTGPDAVTPTFMVRTGWDHLSGFLVVTNAVDLRYLEALREAGKPVVMLNHEVEGFSCPVVRPDNRAGISQAVAHLVGHGHRRIAFAGCLIQSDIRERLDAYREALVEHGIEPDESFVFEATDNLESGGEVAGLRMLTAGVPSTAVVAATDLTALGIMRSLRAAGMILPGDQAITGFDDVEAASSVRPALSTVAQPYERPAQLATTLLISMIRGKPEPDGTRLVPGDFIVRESCGCNAGGAVEGLDELDPELHPTPRDRLRFRLGRTLLGKEPPTAQQAAALDRAVKLLAGGAEHRMQRGQLGADGLHAAAQALYSVSPRWTTLAATVACLRRYQDEVMPSPAAAARAAFDSSLVGLVMELSRAVIQQELNARTALNLAMMRDHQLEMDLLLPGPGKLGSLEWLSHTPARTGCIGLWSQAAPGAGGAEKLLDIVSAEIPDAGGLRLPTQLRPGEFPPAAMLDQVQWEPGEFAVVLPAKTASADLGLVAMITTLDSIQTPGRDRLLETAAQLSAAIEREAITERLQRTNADLATFSHAMAHDLRNPLATILMWASLARSRAGPHDQAEPVLKIVDQIKEVATFSNELITDLLRYAELDRAAAPAEPVDLNLAAGRALASLEAVVVESRAVVETTDLPTVQGSFAELELVLQNLIANAVKYRCARPPRVRIDATRTGSAWVVRCHDNGMGIPEDMWQTVFEPFVRGRSSTEGSGLGLATCRRIVEGLGGWIRVEASGENGTTIAVGLPYDPGPGMSDGRGGGAALGATGVGSGAGSEPGRHAKPKPRRPERPVSHP
jgi:signal transduction histidine kinase/ABC-type sugar transport system substrate-binding protein